MSRVNQRIVGKMDIALPTIINKFVLQAADPLLHYLLLYLDCVATQGGWGGQMGKQLSCSIDWCCRIIAIQGACVICYNPCPQSVRFE